MQEFLHPQGRTLYSHISIKYSVWLSSQALSDNFYHPICHSFLAGCQWSSHHNYFHIARVPSCRHDRINNQATPQSLLIGCDGRHQKHRLPAICHRSVEATLYRGRWNHWISLFDLMFCWVITICCWQKRAGLIHGCLFCSQVSCRGRLDVNKIALHAPGVRLREWQVHRWVWVHVTKRTGPRLWGQEQQAGYVTPRKPASLFWMVSHVGVCRLPAAAYKSKIF